MTIRSSRERDIARAKIVVVVTVLAGGLAIVTPAASEPSRAEPSAADVESARALYVEGLRLRDAGDLTNSSARFQAARALAPTPITTLEHGRALMLLGHWLEARDVLLTVDRLPVRPDESPKAANARVEARAIAEDLRVRIPTVTVSFVGRPDGPLRLTVDGVAVPPEAVTAPRRLNPGKHVFVAEVDGARARTEVVLADRQTKNASLSFLVASSNDDARGTAPRAAPGPVFWSGAALGVAGLTIGSVAGVVALSKASTLSDICSGTHCPRANEGDVSTAKSMAAVSTVGFVLAGVGAAVATVAWMLRPEVKPSAASDIPLSPRAAQPVSAATF